MMPLTGYAKQYTGFLQLIIKLLDLSIIFLCGILTFFLLESSKNIPVYNGFMPQNYLSALTITSLLSAWLFPIMGIYKSWRNESIFKEIGILSLGWICSMSGLMTFLVVTKTAEEISRHWMGLWFIVVSFVLVCFRLAFRALLRVFRKKGFNQRHIVIVGTGELSRQVINKISSAPWTGLNIKGYFTDDKTQTKFSDISFLGTLNEIVTYVETYGIDQIWLTLPLKEMDKIEHLSHQLSSVAVNVILVPDITSLSLLNHSVSQFDGLAIIDISVTPIMGAKRVIKWLEDKILSLVILLLISPLLLLIAFLIKATSQGPILYCQERTGWNGKRFQMLKFRTMPVSPDEKQVWGNANEKQKTWVGKFLRKSSMDELPQFFNVLKGDMSIVGPRPERTVFVEQFKHEIDSYMQKLMVQAGITGWAQINGFRGDTCLKTRVEYDLYYIENWSLLFDLKIIFLTVIKGFRHKHAY